MSGDHTQGRVQDGGVGGGGGGRYVREECQWHRLNDVCNALDSAKQIWHCQNNQFDSCNGSQECGPE